MAWTKVEHDLRNKPEVIAMAIALNVEDRDLIVGKLIRLWEWFDKNTLDGCARGVTQAFIDPHVALDGFAAALESVGWLSIRNGSLVQPNFDRHNSKSAKGRALANMRVKRSRNAAGVTKALPEQKQSRAEKNTASATAQCIDRGVQGGKVLAKADREFVAAPIPGEFLPTLDTILGILQVADADQIGFLAKLAYADASGFEFPKPIWDYVGRAKRKGNKAGYLTEAIRDDMGPERWEAFQSETPSPAHCQWLLVQAGRERGEA